MVSISNLNWNFRNHLAFFLNLLCFLIKLVSTFVLLILHTESLRAGILPVTQIEYLFNGEILDESSILSQALISKTDIERGDTVSHYKIRRCVEAIYSIGDFSQVRVVEKEIESGIILVFQLTSKIRISEIKFDGNILDRDFVLEQIHSETGKEYSEEIAQRDVRKILSLYMDYGYFNARVRFTVPSKKRSADEIPLRFEIAPYARATIGVIKFIDNLAFNDKDIQSALEIESSQFYQKKTVEKEISRLRERYRQKGYLSVQIVSSQVYNSSLNTTALTFRIVEGKRVIVKLIGSGFDKKVLREKLEIFKQGNYSDYVLRSNAQRIRQIYQQKGYYDPQVKFRITKESKEGVVITFDIDLGKVPRIRKIDFVGNDAFSNADLLRQIVTRKRSFFSFPGLGWLFPEGVFDPMAFDRDRKALEIFYKKNGYLNTRIKVEKHVNSKTNQLHLQLKIDEGIQQQIDNLSFEGNTIFGEDQLVSVISARLGMPYSKELVEQDQRKLEILYDRKGYIYTSIEPKYDESTGILIYRVAENKQARLGKFYIHGNLKTKDHVLQREFENAGLKEGEVFSFERLMDAKRELFLLGLFHSISIRTPDRIDQKEILDINVRVEERKPGSISLSGGYNPSSEIFSFKSMRGTFGLNYNNLYGRNLRVSTKARFGTEGNLYETTLIEPWLVGDTIGTFRVFEDNLQEISDITRARGGIASLIKRLGINNKFSVQYKYQELRQRKRELGTTVSSFGLSFHRDNRNHLFNPRNGQLNEFMIEYAGGLLSGATSFIKVTTDHRFYGDVADVIFANAIRLGFEKGLRNQVRLPSFERFRIGGATTVRGYDEMSLGPLDEFGNHRGDVMFVFNTELRFPIYKLVGAAIFFDLGNVWDEPRTLNGLIKDIRVNQPWSALGFGLRIDTALGPARLDYGIPIDQNVDGKLHLALGHAF
ncbi:TPA: outer membrane protein assembly factor BamA [Candidatus Poribacteria bacterium]|nr:outer membrane protein assembly factor BamA [Candidatus Poribacteria bacterium]